MEEISILKIQTSHRKFQKKRILGSSVVSLYTMLSDKPFFILPMTLVSIYTFMRLVMASVRYP